MDRSNHYEAAFEAYLQWHRLAYVAVDETRRAQLGGESVKSLDFVVYGPGGARLLVDVKGRRFPSGAEGRQRRVWECWSTRDDLEGIGRWRELFGPGYRGVLVFAYEILPGVPLADGDEEIWTWQGRRYLLRAVDADDYRRHMRVRSPRWGTMTLPRPAYRDLARPLTYFTRAEAPAALECPF